MRATILLPLLIACTSPSPRSTASSAEATAAWPRCYALRLGGWTPPPGKKLDVTHAPPPVVRLDTLRVGGAVGRVGRRLTPDIPALARGGSIPPSWARLAPDSLELLWSSGYEGVFVTLVERGDSVRGSARAFTDYGSEALAPVSGSRTACPAEGPAR